MKTKTMLMWSAWILLLSGGWAHCKAQRQVSKYTALVRAGDATRDANYVDEKKDAEGRLLEVELQCSSWVHYPLPLKGLSELTAGQSGFEQGASVADSACLIDRHYRVWAAPKDGNALRCVVQHVPVSVMESCFRFQPAK